MCRKHGIGEGRICGNVRDIKSEVTGKEEAD